MWSFLLLLLGASLLVAGTDNKAPNGTTGNATNSSPVLGKAVSSWYDIDMGYDCELYTSSVLVPGNPDTPSLTANYSKTSSGTPELWEVQTVTKCTAPSTSARGIWTATNSGTSTPAMLSPSAAALQNPDGSSDISESFQMLDSPSSASSFHIMASASSEETTDFIGSSASSDFLSSSSTLLESAISDDESSSPLGKETADEWSTDGWPVPVANARQKIDPVLQKGHQLKSLCQQKGQDLDTTDTYRLQTLRSKGSYIFIVDDGFDIDHPELLATAERKVKIVVPENHFSLPKLTRQEIQDGWEDGDEKINDRREDYSHGTAVAGVAAGLEWGVTPAGLVLIKDHGYFVNRRTKRIRSQDASDALLLEIFTIIYDRAMNDPDIDPTKSVVNLSWRISINPSREVSFRIWFAKFDALGLTVVVSAGNQGCRDDDTGGPQSYLDESLPKSLVTDSSPYIIVGGTYHNGEIWHGTTPGRGSNVVSIWAQAVDVKAPLADTNGFANNDGTSFAAPQVSGLAAYLLAYPWPAGQNPFDPKIPGPSIGRRVKLMLQKYAYQRLPRSQIATTSETIRRRLGLELPWEIPPTVPVAYNMAYYDQKCRIVAMDPIGIFPVGIKARNQRFEEYGDLDSCTIPDAPGSGGHGDGMTTGTVFVTDAPTYMPTDWTGFSTPTESVLTPNGTATMMTCAGTSCYPVATTENNSTRSYTYTTVTEVITTTVQPTPTPTGTGPNPNTGIYLAYARECVLDLPGSSHDYPRYNCISEWWFYETNGTGQPYNKCEDVHSAMAASGGVNYDETAIYWPNQSIPINYIVNETSCQYTGTGAGNDGQFYCNGWTDALLCPATPAQETDVVHCNVQGGTHWYDWNVTMLATCDFTR